MQRYSLYVTLNLIDKEINIKERREKNNWGVVLMTLRTYIIRRVIVIIPTLIFISMVIFSLIHLAPGDPLYAMVGRHPIHPDTLEMIRREFGLDQPVYVQYVIWLSKVVRGDLGFSYVGNRPVTAMITEKIPATLELMLVAESIALVIAVTLGVIAAVKHHSLTDAVCSVGALIGYSAPNFWISLIAMMVFAGWLKVLPIGGMGSHRTFNTPLDALVDHLRHLVLPASILVIGWTAYLFRMVRSSMLDVLRQDYITTARAKGLKERVVIYKHALRNALLPVITYEGYSIGFLLSGAAVVETIFSWPGLGRFMVEIAGNRNYPVLMGLSMIIAVMVLTANLGADLAYAIVDPRIRYD